MTAESVAPVSWRLSRITPNRLNCTWCRDGVSQLHSGINKVKCVQWSKGLMPLKLKTDHLSFIFNIVIYSIRKHQTWVQLDREQRQAAVVGTFHHIIAVKAGELEGFIGWILSDMKKNKNNVNACAQKLLMLSHDPAALSCDSLEDPWVKFKKKTKKQTKTGHETL